MNKVDLAFLSNNEDGMSAIDPAVIEKVQGLISALPESVFDHLEIYKADQIDSVGVNISNFVTSRYVDFRVYNDGYTVVIDLNPGGEAIQFDKLDKARLISWVDQMNMERDNA